MRTGTRIPPTMHMIMHMHMITGMRTPMGVTHTPWLPSR
jgi:hypothetical protein